MFGSAKILPATVEFVDIAGIVRGASEGEGLGNKFLSHIRESAAICQVTRVFRDEDVTHVDGEVNPANDISTIQTELILADLQTVEKAIPRLEKEARGKKELAANLDAAREALGRLEAGTPIIATKVDRALIRELSLLTAKPFIYVFNCDADELADEALKDKMRGTSSRRPRRSSSTRSSSPSWSSSTTTRRRARCSPRWASTSPASRCWPGSASTPSACRPTSPPVRRRPAPGRSRKGATAPEAAGVIHTDFQRGFIKAEIVSFDDLMAAGSMAQGQGGRQGPHGGQGLRHARRRRRGVPLQRLTSLTRRVMLGV